MYEYMQYKGILSMTIYLKKSQVIHLNRENFNENYLYLQ